MCPIIRSALALYSIIEMNGCLQGLFKSYTPTGHVIIVVHKDVPFSPRAARVHRASKLQA